MKNLQLGTRGSDIDRAIEDAPEQRPCPVCGHDAGECTCGKKIRVGSIVVLSPKGRKELPTLRRNKGTVAARGYIPHVWVIVWRLGYVMHNHESNLEVIVQ